MTEDERTLLISGGTPLEGEVRVPGAKNVATKLLVASLLSDRPVTLENVPDIGDVAITVDLCREIGSEVEWERESGRLHIVTPSLRTSYIPQRFSGANRIPILMLGALLGRTHEEIIIPLAGGCHLGQRTVDFHIEALRQLGATVEYRSMKHEGAYFAYAHHGLKGAKITLPYPSVGATENALLAASNASGETWIHNVAIEPEMIDLILFLQKMGLSIAFDGDRTLRVKKTQRFQEVHHRVIPDRLVAASFGMAAIATQGNVFVREAEPRHLLPFLYALREIGGGFSVEERGISFFHEGPLKGGLHLETDVYPGFATDWQQPFSTLLTQAEGISVVHDTVYERRFGYTEALNEMGADTHLFTSCLGSRRCRFAHGHHFHSLVVKGPTPLSSRPIVIPDLRAGFAYVMAALMAKGESELFGLSLLERGYEALPERLLELGAELSIQEKKKKPPCSEVTPKLASLTS